MARASDERARPISSQVGNSMLTSRQEAPSFGSSGSQWKRSDVVTRHLGGHVPQRHIDQSGAMDRDLLKATGFPDAVPEIYLHQRIGADQFVPQPPIVLRQEASVIGKPGNPEHRSHQERAVPAYIAGKRHGPSRSPGLTQGHCARYTHVSLVRR